MLDLTPTVAAIGLGMFVAVVTSPPPAGTIMKVLWVANVAFLVLNTCVLVGTLVLAVA